MQSTAPHRSARCHTASASTRTAVPRSRGQTCSSHLCISFVSWWVRSEACGGYDGYARLLAIVLMIGELLALRSSGRSCSKAWSLPSLALAAILLWSVRRDIQDLLAQLTPIKEQYRAVSKSNQLWAAPISHIFFLL